MKIKMNIKRMVVGLMAVTICCGCADLSEDLTGQPTSDKFFKTIVDFNSYISGAYTPPLSSSMEKMHPTLRVPVRKMYVPR